MLRHRVATLVIQIPRRMQSNVDIMKLRNHAVHNLFVLHYQNYGARGAAVCITKVNTDDSALVLRVISVIDYLD